MGIWKIILLPLAVTAGLAAQCEQIGIPTLARVQGLVIDNEGKPLEGGVTVAVYSTKPDRTVNAKLGTATTNKKG